MTQPTQATEDDDDDASSLWAAFREAKQKKRRSNLAYSTQQLVTAGIVYEAHNGGIHLVIHTRAEIIDFWPSTGLWWIRGTRNKRRGIVKLIKYVSGKQACAMRAIAPIVP